MRAKLFRRDALPQEPGFREELDAFFEGLRDTSRGITRLWPGVTG